MIKTKYRVIKTKIPSTLTLQIIEDLQKYEPLSMTQNQLPIVWDRAEDFSVWDKFGNKFIDFTSGIFVSNCGHSVVRKAIVNQAMVKSLLYSYDYPTEIRLKYLKELTKFTGFEKAFLLPSGADATEAACKIMRKATNKAIIFSFRGAMHGKTFFTEALKGLEYSQHIKLLDYPKPYNHFEDMIKDINPHFLNNCAGIIIESYRGWDAEFFSPFFIQELVSWAKKNRLLVCFDEIQAGFGRTGKLFAYEYYKVKPDLVCCGKGISGGVALSAVLGSGKLLDSCDDLSSTNSGSPLVCAAGLANLEEFKKKNLIEKAKTKGIEFSLYLKGLINYPLVTSINSCGLVGAIIFKSTEIANKICIKCLQKGVIVVKTGRESIKLGPPLTITSKALIEGLRVIEECIKEVSNEIKACGDTSN